MGRLIDADEILRIAQGEFSEDDMFKIRWLISHIETATNNNGDLISRRALIDRIKIPAEWEYHDERRKTFNEVLDYIKKMPTAYDVEAVVAELKKIRDDENCDSVKMADCLSFGDCQLCLMNRAISIVRGKE